MIRTFVAFVGRGIAGLDADRKLFLSGIDPVIPEKGRGIVGWMATRGVENVRFASEAVMANSAIPSLGGDGGDSAA